jgi:hypothetical protein
MKVDAEPLGDDALEVDAPPAHNAVDLAIGARCSSDRRGFGPSVQLSNRPSGPEALKRWIQSRSVCRSMPPIFAAPPRSIPLRTAANERSLRLWLTFFDRRASPRNSSAE